MCVLVCIQNLLYLWGGERVFNIKDRVYLNVDIVDIEININRLVTDSIMP